MVFVVPQWFYLTKSIIWMRNRELPVYLCIAMYFITKTRHYITLKQDSNWVNVQTSSKLYRVESIHMMKVMLNSERDIICLIPPSRERSSLLSKQRSNS